jgi:hypothetical protein
LVSNTYGFLNTRIGVFRRKMLVGCKGSIKKPSTDKSGGVKGGYQRIIESIGELIN